MKSLETKLCVKYDCPEYTFAQSYSTQNAMAWSDGNNTAIRYNPNFMNMVFHRFGVNSSVGIFAHELGHIIDFHSGESFTRYELERRADEYAGCSIALFGNPESSITPIASTLLTMPSSSQYPSPSERVKAVLDGYESCK